MSIDANQVLAAVSAFETLAGPVVEKLLADHGAAGAYEVAERATESLQKLMAAASPEFAEHLRAQLQAKLDARFPNG